MEKKKLKLKNPSDISTNNFTLKSKLNLEPSFRTSFSQTNNNNISFNTKKTNNNKKLIKFLKTEQTTQKKMRRKIQENIKKIESEYDLGKEDFFYMEGFNIKNFISREDKFNRMNKINKFLYKMKNVKKPLNVMLINRNSLLNKNKESLSMSKERIYNLKESFVYKNNDIYDNYKNDNFNSNKSMKNFNTIYTNNKSLSFSILNNNNISNNIQTQTNQYNNIYYQYQNSKTPIKPRTALYLKKKSNTIISKDNENFSNKNFKHKNKLISNITIESKNASSERNINKPNLYSFSNNRLNLSNDQNLYSLFNNFLINKNEEMKINKKELFKKLKMDIKRQDRKAKNLLYELWKTRHINDENLRRKGFVNSIFKK